LAGELNAVKGYKADGSNLNAEIRRDDWQVSLDAETIDAVVKLDRTIRKFQLPESIVAYQGVKRFEGVESLHPESRLINPAFVSVSLLEEKAKRFRGVNDKPRYLVEYQLRQGFNALPIDGYSLLRRWKFAYQMELLIGRAVWFNVLEVRDEGEQVRIIVWASDEKGQESSGEG